MVGTTSAPLPPLSHLEFLLARLADDVPAVSRVALMAADGEVDAEYPPRVEPSPVATAFANMSAFAAAELAAPGGRISITVESENRILIVATLPVGRSLVVTATNTGRVDSLVFETERLAERLGSLVAGAARGRARDRA